MGGTRRTERIKAGMKADEDDRRSRTEMKAKKHKLGGGRRARGATNGGKKRGSSKKKSDKRREDRGRMRRGQTRTAVFLCPRCESDQNRRAVVSLRERNLRVP